MKNFARFASIVTLIIFIGVPSVQSAQKKTDNSKQKVEQTNPANPEQHLSQSAESHDPHWRPHKRKVDFIITEVSLTRHPTTGNISVHAKIKNIGDKSTSDLIRIVFEGYVHVWIHGLREGETKGVGFDIDDNAHHNRAVAPITVAVNNEGEIAEKNTRNNTCTGARLLSTQTRSVHHCP